MGCRGSRLKSEDIECTICSMKPADLAITPCGHAFYCDRCMGKIMSINKLCPSCRGYIGKVQRIFIQ